MTKNINFIRKKLQSYESSIGTWQQIPSSSISEILGNAGYDWVAVDLEHGSFSNHQLPDFFRAIENADCIPLARISEPTAVNCKLALDAGAKGIIAPMIETAEQVKLVIDSCCWPPSGKRGVGYNRANLYGKNFDSYLSEAQSPLIVIQIESIKAVNNLNDILKVKGIDAVMVGPYDLSASMGITGDFHNDEFVKTLDNILLMCKNNKVAIGDHVVQPDPKQLSQRISEGYTFIAYGTDGVFLNTSSKLPT